MREIDPWKSFENPPMTEVRHVILGENVNAKVGIANIYNRTYAVPMVWNEVEGLYEVITAGDILNPGNILALKLWSQIGNYLREQLRDEKIYLLMHGVANLDHSPRHQR